MKIKPGVEVSNFFPKVLASIAHSPSLLKPFGLGAISYLLYVCDVIPSRAAWHEDLGIERA